MRIIIITVFTAATISVSCSQKSNRITSATLIMSDSVAKDNVVAFFDQSSPGGNTSVSNDLDYNYKWSGQSPFTASGFGYFTPDGHEIPYVKRNRDIGQTFTYKGKAPRKLKSITVRLGFGDNVVRTGTYGQSISIQLFEVSGKRTLNNNGSDSTKKAFHGYPHNRVELDIPHERDDFLEGIKFEMLAVMSGFKFPEKVDFGFDNSMNIDPDHQNLKGKYLNFIIPEQSQIILEPTKEYAFLVMIDSIGENRGFTLGNLMNGHYPGGFGIRREGHGIFPPVTAYPEFNFNHPLNRPAVKTSLFPSDFKERILVPPGSNGYPDVDTYRDLEFYIKI